MVPDDDKGIKATQISKPKHEILAPTMRSELNFIRIHHDVIWDMICFLSSQNPYVERINPTNFLANS
jgi:hypothetical protein